MGKIVLNGVTYGGGGGGGTTGNYMDKVNPAGTGRLIINHASTSDEGYVGNNAFIFSEAATGMASTADVKDNLIVGNQSGINMQSTSSIYRNILLNDNVIANQPQNFINRNIIADTTLAGNGKTILEVDRSILMNSTVIAPSTGVNSAYVNKSLMVGSPKFIISDGGFNEHNTFIGNASVVTMGSMEGNFIGGDYPDVTTNGGKGMLIYGASIKATLGTSKNERPVGVEITGDNSTVTAPELSNYGHFIVKGYHNVLSCGAGGEDVIIGSNGTVSGSTACKDFIYGIYNGINGSDIQYNNEFGSYNSMNGSTLTYNTFLGHNNMMSAGTATYNFALGFLNRFNGAEGQADHNTAIGENNVIVSSGGRNIVVGGASTANGFGHMIFGNDSQISKSKKGIIAGHDNNIWYNGSGNPFLYASIFGSKNGMTITDSAAFDSLVFGNGNSQTFKSTGNIVFGNYNKTTSMTSNNFVLGNANTANFSGSNGYDYRNVVIGNNNNLQFVSTGSGAYNNIVIGNETTINVPSTSAYFYYNTALSRNKIQVNNGNNGNVNYHNIFLGYNQTTVDGSNGNTFLGYDNVTTVDGYLYGSIIGGYMTTSNIANGNDGGSIITGARSKYSLKSVIGSIITGNRSTVNATAENYGSILANYNSTVNLYATHNSLVLGDSSSVNIGTSLYGTLLTGYSSTVQGSNYQGSIIAASQSYVSGDHYGSLMIGQSNRTTGNAYSSIISGYGWNIRNIGDNSGNLYSGYGNSSTTGTTNKGSIYSGYSNTFKIGQQYGSIFSGSNNNYEIGQVYGAIIGGKFNTIQTTASYTTASIMPDFEGGIFVPQNTTVVGNVFNGGVVAGTGHKLGTTTTAIDQYNSLIVGQYSTAYGTISNNIVGGAYHKLAGVQNSIVTGLGNTLEQPEGYTLNNVLVSGEGLIANENKQTVLGQYNTTPTTATALAIGNGVSTARSNAFEVDWDGSANLAGDLTVHYGGSAYNVGACLSTASGGGGGGSSSHTYSTTEQAVGTWIDGSTVYERTIVSDYMPYTSDPQIIADDLADWNIGMIVEFSPIIQQGFGEYSLSYSYAYQASDSGNQAMTPGLVYIKTYTVDNVDKLCIIAYPGTAEFESGIVIVKVRYIKATT